MERALLGFAALLVLGSSASAQAGFTSGFGEGSGPSRSGGGLSVFVGRPAPSHMDLSTATSGRRNRSASSHHYLDSS